MARVAVIGAGTMGHALALVFALGGHQVRLTDSNEATLARAQGLMEKALATLVEGGEAPADWTSAHLAQHVTRHDGGVIGLQPAQGRHERRIEPAFADDPAHEIGQAEGGEKRIRHGPGSERLREQDVPDEAENAGGDGAEADQGR